MIEIAPISWEDAYYFPLDPKSDGGNSYPSLYIGPLDPVCNPVDAQRVTLRHPDDRLSWGRKMYGECDCSHYTIDGKLIINTFAGNITSSPTATYPHQVVVHNVDVTPTLTMSWGFPVPSTTALMGGISLLGYGGWVNDEWIAYLSTRYGSDPTRLNSIAKITARRYSSTRITVTKTLAKVRSSPYVIPKDFRNASVSDLEAWYEAMLLEPTQVAVTKPILNKLVSLRYKIVVKSIVSTEDALARVGAYARQCRDKGEYPQPPDFGDMAMAAIEKKDALNINLISFLRDFRHPLDMVPKLKNLKSVKTWASNFLGTYYGILPTVSDLKKIHSSFEARLPYLDRNGWATFNKRFEGSNEVEKTNFLLERNLKLVSSTEDNAFISLMERLRNFGAFPSFENLWDLVPYSFVLDWFIDVGSFLETVDSRLRLTELKIPYSTMSDKKEASFDASQLDRWILSGPIVMRYYHRWTIDHCPLPRLALQSPITEFDHWIESSALIIQRAKKIR